MQIDSSNRRRLGIQLVGLARRWRRALDHRLAAIGLSDASWAPLVHLAEQGDGLCQKELALAVGIDDSTLVRLLDLLAERGLVERRTATHDRRLKQLYLTAEGRTAVTDIRAKLARIEDLLLEDLSDAQIDALMAAFASIDGRIQAAAAPTAATAPLAATTR
ncbi:MarR family winged helix-turn-helix transcriptional regulator [Xanthobacter agilis]|jgi:MarR family transcriptional regulator for hemolysin|uniref:MarR family transcriptional regulator for hemolysin n=1 Tax=Xanthobacter agilis TaxID=47492 RepID=A0ABU0LF24_XANAG|nr:MarR family transcriptional regulator [Xanthobacter agilis]MDQ0505751.1 MarR family transcriptional regulator for hemolysin [Xanthobacter agilis]